MSCQPKPVVSGCQSAHKFYHKDHMVCRYAVQDLLCLYGGHETDATGLLDGGRPSLALADADSVLRPLLPSLSRHWNELSSTRMCRVGVVWRLGTSNLVT